MKKLLILLLAASLALSGCSAATPAVQAMSATPGVAETDTPKPEEIVTEEAAPPEDNLLEEAQPEKELVPQVESQPENDPASEDTPPVQDTPVQPKPTPQNQTPLVSLGSTTATTKKEPSTDSKPEQPKAPTTDNTATATYPPATDNNVLMFARNAQTIFVGEQGKLDIFYFGNKTLRWYSSHPKGLTVDQSGLITPIYEGNYTVYVTDGEYTAEAYIFAPKDWGMSSGLYFDHLETELTVGKSSLLNLNGVAPGIRIFYSSSDTSVVRVSGSYMTAVAPGTAIVTAQSAYSEMAKMLVTVVPASDAVSLDIRQSSLDLFMFDEITLDRDYSGTSQLEWSSSNWNVARVDENGLVFACGEGSCYIYLSDGTYADECKVTVSIDPSVKVTQLGFNNINAPIYDGVTKYKGDYMSFRISVFPQNADRDTYITVSDPQVIAASCTYALGEPVFRLDFKKAGSCTVNIHSGDHEVTNSYTFHVKEDYDCNPGPGLLTPEEFANCYNQALQANGMALDYMPTGYLVLTLTPQELTWEQARKSAEGLGHHWWSIGYRHMLVTYEGTDQNGNHIFYERGC